MDVSYRASGRSSVAIPEGIAVAQPRQSNVSNTQGNNCRSDGFHPQRVERYLLPWDGLSIGSKCNQRLGEFGSTRTRRISTTAN